jgi:hypothetical protein
MKLPHIGQEALADINDFSNYTADYAQIYSKLVLKIFICFVFARNYTTEAKNEGKKDNILG